MAEMKPAAKPVEAIAISPKELKKLKQCKKKFFYDCVGLSYDGAEDLRFSVEAVERLKELLVSGEDHAEGKIRTLYEAYSPEWFSCEKEFLSAKENSMKRVLRLYEYMKTRTMENLRENVFFERSFANPLYYRGYAIKTIKGRFDLVFSDENGRQVAVIFHYGKPTESSKARIKGNLPENSAEIMSAAIAARAVLTDFAVEVWYLRSKDDSGSQVVPVFDHRPEKNVIKADYSMMSDSDLLRMFISVLCEDEKCDCDKCRHRSVCKADPTIRVSEKISQTVEKNHTDYRLTDSQKEVVNHVNGPMCVVAVPGAGKTASLVKRMVHLIRDVHVKPGQILFVTFTKKAAKEITARVEEELLTSGIKGRPEIMTYHALGFSILKENPLHVGHRIKLADDLDRYSLIFQALKMEKEIQGLSYLNPRGEHGIVRFLDRKFEEISERGEESFRVQYGERYDVEGILGVYKAYRTLYEKEGFINYNDQISMVNELFDAYSVLPQRYADKYEFIMVDEFQDSSQEQVDMIYAIAHCHNNLVVVGDDDQSIYQWRGGSSRYMLEFSSDFPEAETVYMEDNFRSNRKILELCSALIKGNGERYEKELRAHAALGTDKKPVYLKDVSADVLKDVVRYAERNGYRYGEIAVLGRNNKRLEEVSKILDEVCPVSIPKDYMIEDAIFRCIYDVMTLFYKGMDSDTALYRYLGLFGITDITKQNRYESLYSNMIQMGKLMPVELTPECLQKYSREVTPEGKAVYVLLTCFEKLAYGQLLESLKHIVNVCLGLESHLVVDDLADMAEERGIVKQQSLYEVMQEMMIFQSTERVGYDSCEDAVNLLTCHDAKGKEFPLVIIYGMEDFDMTEEEIRVLYVAMSRAKRELFMVETAYNRFAGFNRISLYCDVQGGR